MVKFVLSISKLFFLTNIFSFYFAKLYFIFRASLFKRRITLNIFILNPKTPLNISISPTFMHLSYVRVASAIILIVQWTPVRICCLRYCLFLSLFNPPFHCCQVISVKPNSMLPLLWNLKILIFFKINDILLSVNIWIR